ncbi:YkyB family protein [Bacillus cytotoxicus]|uniref:YkyB family protein n=1 Tax=Bacillus cytotoxicus TaxID=580165 RepID=UPI00244CE711|nr:YkyB family protein [Bacillus cytotoxicus]MDH2882393.1 hypothetical protein [Bacillus cytotoxicus]
MESITKEITLYTKWKNVSENLKTKIQLKEMRLKPADVEKPAALIKTYLHGKWRVLNLYDVNTCIEIKKRKVKDIELTIENISEALYVINKSAKKSRDTKKESYYRRDFSIVKASKTRESKLYALKDRVMEKLIAEEKVEIMGYHKQQDKRYDDSFHYLLLLKIGDHTFHRPVEFYIARKYKNLGEIDIISAEAKKCKLKFNESVKLLEKYIGKSMNSIHEEMYSETHLYK